MKSIAAGGPAGCVRPPSAPTTASSPPAAWWWAWPRPSPSQAAILLAAVAGLAAGALSMAAGEYVSVSSQADTEQADLTRERGELATSPEAERTELAEIYVARGLGRELATQVADQLMAHDALGAHARDELGIHEFTRARPIQAALASAGAFAVGAAPPALLAAFAAGREPHAGHRGRDAGTPARPRRRRGPPRRRLARARGAARRVLGRGGHGVHGGGRAPVRRGRLGTPVRHEARPGVSCGQCRTRPGAEETILESSMKGYIGDIEMVAEENVDFRQVLYTAKNCQLVVMALKPREEIGAEVHHLDQFFRVEEGSGEAVLDGVRTAIRAGFAVLVPAGTNHNIINTGREPLKLYTLLRAAQSSRRRRPPHPRGGGGGRRALRRQDDGIAAVDAPPVRHPRLRHDARCDNRDSARTFSRAGPGGGERLRARGPGVEVVGVPADLGDFPRDGLALTPRRKLLGTTRTTLTQRKLDADRERIRHFLARRGYPDAVVDGAAPRRWTTASARR